jgi:hypothetical protein
MFASSCADPIKDPSVGLYNNFGQQYDFKDAPLENQDHLDSIGFKAAPFIRYANYYKGI